MKKHLILPVLAVFMLAAGCGPSSGTMTPLEELPANYSLEQAKEDGCVTHEDGDITQGQEKFDAFLSAAESGKPAEVRVVFYYTLGDPSRYDPDYYETIKDDYPWMYIRDISFDGETYTVRRYEDGEEILRDYQFLMRYEGQAESPHALYQSYVRYVLTNDDTVTWQELFYGAVSSSVGGYIDHHTVYTDLIYE